jgi:hypothetical protein
MELEQGGRALSHAHAAQVVHQWQSLGVDRVRSWCVYDHPLFIIRRPPFYPQPAALDSGLSNQRSNSMPRRNIYITYLFDFPKINKIHY